MQMTPQSIPTKLAALLLSAGMTAATAASWRVTDIGHLGGGFTTPMAVNGNGQIVGFSRLGTIDAPGRETAFSYRSGAMTDIGTPLFGNSVNNRAGAIGEGGHVVLGARDGRLASFDTQAGSGRLIDAGAYRVQNVVVNRSGQIAATVSIDNGDPRNPGASLAATVVGDRLESLGLGISRVADINDSGTIVGTRLLLPSKTERGYLRKADGTVVDFGLSDSDDYTSLRAINNSGQAAGSFIGAQTGSRRAAVYVPTRDELIFLNRNDLRNEALDINERGEVLGRWDFWNVKEKRIETHAFLFNGYTTATTDLGMDFDEMRLNNLGQVLGHHNTDMFLWDAGRMLNLEDLVGGLGILDVEGAVLGDNGHIAGWGTDDAGNWRAFHLSQMDDDGTPVSAPGTLALAFLGLLPLFRRRPWTALDVKLQ